MSFDGGNSENEIWAEDLRELLHHLDALPAFIGGSSSGCRLALLLALRHPAAVRGLLLWRVTGGAYAAERLVRTTTPNSSRWRRRGGMAAVCQSEHFSDVIKANPANRARLPEMRSRISSRSWSAGAAAFNEGADHPVIGLSPAELRSMTMPACIIPGNDRVHPRAPARSRTACCPNSEYHEVLTEDRPDLDVALEDWEKKEGLLAAIFIDFLRRAQRHI